MARMARSIQPHGQDDDVHHALTVLGNTVRAAIIHELGSGPVLGPELAKRLDLPSGTLSPQLLVLRDAEVIHCEAQSGHGRPILHTLNTRKLEEIGDLAGAYLGLKIAGT